MQYYKILVLVMKNQIAKNKIFFLFFLFLGLSSCKTLKDSESAPYNQDDYYYDLDYDYYDYDDYDRG